MLGFEESVLFSEDKDWINLQSIDNPKNGRWIQQFHDKNFDWEIMRLPTVSTAVSLIQLQERK